jgi:hypothetical protein
MVVLRFSTIRLLARRSLTITPPSPKMQWKIESDANTRSRRREVSSQRSLFSLRSGSTNLWAVQGAGGGCLSGGCAPCCLRGLVRPDRITDETTGGGARSRLEPADAKKALRGCTVGTDFPGTKSPSERRNKCLIILGFLVLPESIQRSTSPPFDRLQFTRAPSKMQNSALRSLTVVSSMKGCGRTFKAHWSREGTSRCML